MTCVHRWRRRLALVMCLLCLASAVAAAQRPQVIRGRITSDSGTVIAGADIFVTIAPTAEVVRQKSDSLGAYRVVIPNPTGEYLVYIGALGRKPMRQRVTIAAGDSVAVVDAKLATMIATVATVHVEARRPRPTRSLGSDAGQAGTDGMDKFVDGVSNALPPELRGNIDAMAALIPGLSVTAAGISAFGMGPDANMSTLNGMSFGGGNIPRSIVSSTRFATSPWDPTRGGFSGALASTTLSRGGNVAVRRGYLTLDSPALQVGDETAERFGQTFTNITADAGGSGSTSLDKYFYNYGFHVSRITARASSLLDLDADALSHAGISADSASRLIQILGAQHVPLDAAGIPGARTTTSGTFLERFDYAVPTLSATAIPSPTWYGIVGANYAKSEAQSLGPVSPPAAGGTTTSAGAMLQGVYSRFLGANGDYVNETSVGVSVADTTGKPYLTLPGANVLIASDLTDGAASLGSLSVGGNSALSRESKQLTMEIDNQTSFLAHGLAALPMKLFLQSRFERFDQSIAANRLGTFSFASLSDLASQTPSSYSRTLNVPDRSGGEWTGAGALGGSWNTSKLVLTGGARVDANTFVGLPQANPVVAQLFGQSNDHGPNSVGVSPRLAFNWYYNARRGMSSSGTPISLLSRGGPQIRGGIGEFRGTLRSTLLSDAIGSTGLPGATSRLLCTGLAAPAPDWQAYEANPATIPQSCVGGASTFADTVPNVTMFGRRYGPQRSWRGALGWTNTIWNTYFAIDGTYSLNLDQPGTVDLNFSGVPRFTMPSEANRPVFVDASSVVASTGSSSPVQSRLSSAFGRVADRVSDLRGDAKQITLYLIPPFPFSIGIFTTSYSYTDARQQSRGFDQTTAGDPRAVDWSSIAYVPRHRFSIQGAHPFFGSRLWVTSQLFVVSGFRFTPVVSGDVNGDGSFGDRAFIFDPAHAPDAGVATGLKALLASGPSAAKNCLQRQLSTIAGQNSCVGPWSATMNASVVVVPAIPHTDKRAHISVNLANPLGGLDQMLHGSNNLHGWGATPVIDGTLYQVRGFDPAAQRFLYTVNSRFGSSSPSTSTFRTPFRVTVDVQLDLGHSAAEQSLALNLRIRPPLAGTRASADTIKKRYMGCNSNGFSDVYAILLHYADSLALSREQTEKLQARQLALDAQADSIFGSLATYLAGLPARYDASAAIARINATSDAMWKIIYAEGPYLRSLFTPGQLRIMPGGGLREMITTPNYLGRFAYCF